MSNASNFGAAKVAKKRVKCKGKLKFFFSFPSESIFGAAKVLSP